MGLGIILLDEYSMIRYINPNGERFVDNSPLLQISENRLQAVGGTDNRRLQKLVSEALATSFGRGLVPEVLFDCIILLNQNLHCSYWSHHGILRMTG